MLVSMCILNPPSSARPCAIVPFAFTHCAFRLGIVAWSLCCSKLSGGSWYIRLLLLRRRVVFLFLLLAAMLIFLSALCTHSGGEGCGSRGGLFAGSAKVRPGR